jgi:cell division protein FtsZ
VLINVTGGPDLMLFEVDEAVNRVRAEVESDANILFGSALSEDMEGRVRVSVVATGIDAETCRGFVADNVQKLHLPRRKQGEIAQPAPLAPARAVETMTVSRLQVQMDNLAHDLNAHLEYAVPEPVLAEVAPAPQLTEPQTEEPFELGGAEAPIIEEPAPPPPLGEFHHQEPPKRRRFGLFGRRRPEREDYIEPRVEMPGVIPAAPVAAAPQRAAPPPRTAAPPRTREPAPAPAVREPSQAMPISQRAAAENLQTRDDLFAGVAEDERFEIPAFLRRQANAGS